jgi:hypothetical protein
VRKRKTRRRAVACRALLHTRRAVQVLARLVLPEAENVLRRVDRRRALRQLGPWVRRTSRTAFARLLSVHCGRRSKGGGRRSPRAPRSG